MEDGQKMRALRGIYILSLRHEQARSIADLLFLQLSEGGNQTMKSKFSIATALYEVP